MKVDRYAGLSIGPIFGFNGGTWVWVQTRYIKNKCGKNFVTH